MRKFGFLFLTLAGLAFAAPAYAQLQGPQPQVGDSCAAVPQGATMLTGDTNNDRQDVVIICDGSTWQAMISGSGSEADPTVPASVKDGVDWSELSGIPAGFADGTDDAGGGGGSINSVITVNRNNSTTRDFCFLSRVSNTMSFGSFCQITGTQGSRTSKEMSVSGDNPDCRMTCFNFD